MHLSYPLPLRSQQEAFLKQQCKSEIARTTIRFSFLRVEYWVVVFLKDNISLK